MAFIILMLGAIAGMSSGFFLVILEAPFEAQAMCLGFAAFCVVKLPFAVANLR